MGSVSLLSIVSLLTHGHFHVVPRSPPGHLLSLLFVLNLERLFRVGIHNSNSDLQRKRLCCENRRNAQTRALITDFVYIRLLALRTGTVLTEALRVLLAFVGATISATILLPTV